MLYVSILHTGDLCNFWIRSHAFLIWHVSLKLISALHICSTSCSTLLHSMDFDFDCNRLSCRKSLTEKAVIISHWLVSSRLSSHHIWLGLLPDYLWGLKWWTRLNICWHFPSGSHIFCSKSQFHQFGALTNITQQWTVWMNYSAHLSCVQVQ